MFIFEERAVLRRTLLAVLVVAASGCAYNVATSGRVVLKDDNTVVDIRFSDRDRAFIREYYDRGKKKKGLPPGLAKRGGNLPPGLAKRDKLPPGLRGDPLPTELEQRLSPLPSSYVRLKVGQDFVLMDRKTRVVLDMAVGLGD